DEVEIVNANKETEPAPEYEIDFDTMTLTGRMITGLDAVKQWIRLCLEVPRYRYTQYPWTYGQDFEELIGRSYTEGDLKPILEKMVNEAFFLNSEIKAVTNFSVKKDGDHVTMSFIVSTDYGDEKYQHTFIGG
ncbi:MAG: DUF2634 domain-containing protein, partial [Candidatus Methanomethylophilaceae archaeon]|nr:DUF2634 domain-containing protein [Candidatus Methanomethylophilaceae archaeon]